MSYRPWGGTESGWSVAGVPYPDAKSLESFARVPPPFPNTVGVLMAHCFAEPRARDFFGEPVHAYASIHVPGYSVYHFGHDHSDHGEYEIDGRYYVNVGALGRGSLSGDETSRRPKLVVVTNDGGISVRPFALRVKPAEEVFDFEAKQRRDAEASVVQAFVEHLEASSHALEDIPSHVAKLDLPPDVLPLVSSMDDCINLLLSCKH